MNTMLMAIVAVFATLFPTSGQAYFAARVEAEHPEVTVADARVWVGKMCDYFDEGYELSDFPRQDDEHMRLYLFLLDAGVPVFCPEHVDALT